MASVLAYGVSVYPGPRHLDLTPLTAIVVAIIVARFVIGLRLTPPLVAGAAFAGALWAYAAQPLGVIAPTAAAVVLITALRALRTARGRRPRAG